MYHSEFNLEKQFSEYYVSLTTMDFQNIRVQITIYVPPYIACRIITQNGLSGAGIPSDLHSVLPRKIKHWKTDRILFLILKGTVKWSRYRPGVAQRVGRGTDYSFLTTELEGGEWSAARPGRTLPPGKTRYPLYRSLGGPQGRSGRAENLVPTGVRSRTVQPVVSRYTDWDSGPTIPKGIKVYKNC